MSGEFRKALESGKVIIFDGAMGTQLAARGVTPGALASLSASVTVRAVHRAYREAGADVLTTNTFGANRSVLSRAGGLDDLPRYVAESCRLAREAAGGGGFIAGDVGPSGEILQPYGPATDVVVSLCFQEIAKLLVDNGVDLLLVETMSDVFEMKLAVEACRQAASKPQKKTPIPVAATMSFDPSRQGGFRTNMGVPPAEAARAMVEAEADIVGANCGSVTPEQIAQIVREFRSVTDKPILIQANAGVPELQAGQTIFRLAPKEWAAGMLEVRAAGAQLLGGCCGTTPEHIRCLRRAVDKR